MTFDQGQPLEIHLERPTASALTVHLSGEFDLAARDRFAAALKPTQDGIRELVIDLGGLTFIDSTGIRCLLDVKTRTDHDGILMFVALPVDGQVRQVFAVTGLDEAFSAPAGRAAAEPGQHLNDH